MQTITFVSNSKNKANLLIQVAKEMGIGLLSNHELTDEEMALPGKKPTKQQLENWLAKDDGKDYEVDEAFDYVKKQLRLLKTKK